MKTGANTYIHYDQDVSKSYSSYLCHTLARKNTHSNSIPPFSIESPLLFSNFLVMPFLWIFGKGGGGGSNYGDTLFILASSVLCQQVRDSWITKTSKAIINAVKISERKASQRRREVFSLVYILYDLSNHLSIFLLMF